MPYFVYVVGSPENAFSALKIGIADNVNKRLAGLQTGCPMELVVLAAFRLGSQAAARRLENAAHQHFARRRVRGEWFSATFREIESFLSRRKVEFRGRFGPQTDVAEQCIGNGHLFSEIRGSRKLAA